MYYTAKTTHCSVQLAFVLTKRSNLRPLKMGSVACRGSSWMICCAASAVPLGVTAGQSLLPGSQVCARTVRCDPPALCQAIGSCGGPAGGKASTPEPLEWESTWKCREKQPIAQGSIRAVFGGSDVSCVLMVFVFPHLHREQVLPDSSPADS